MRPFPPRSSRLAILFLLAAATSCLAAALQPGVRVQSEVIGSRAWELEVASGQLHVLSLSCDGPLVLWIRPPGEPGVRHELTAASTDEEVRFVSGDAARWTLAVEAETAVSLSMELRTAPPAPSDELQWRSELEFARALEAIAGDEPTAAKAAARRAVEARAAMLSDRLELASFTEELGVEFALAESDSLRAAGEEFLERTLELRRQAAGERSFLVADTQNTLSSYYYLLGDFERAVELQEQSVRTLESLPDVSDSTLAYARNDLGLSYYQVGRYPQARDCFETALVLYEKLDGVRFPVADIHNSLGEVYRLSGDLDTSRASFRRAEEEISKLIEASTDADERDDYERFQAIVWLNQAGLLYDDSLYDEAEVLYRRAAELWTRKGSQDPINLPQALMNLADICRIQGRYGEALDLFVRSFETAQRDLGPDHPDTSWPQNYLAQLLVEMGRHDAAEENYRECIRRLQDAGEAGAARLGFPLRGLGDLYAAREDHLHAAEWYRRSADRFTSTQGDLSVEAARSTVARAQALFHEGSAENVAEASTLLEAIEPALEANPRFPELQIAARTLEAELAHRTGQTSLALEVLNSALDEAESIRRASSLDDRGRASFFADYAPSYRKLAQWSLLAGDLEGTVQAIERFRSRVLLDQMRAAQVDLRSGIPPEVLAGLDARRRQATRELTETELEIQRLRTAGSRVDPELIRRRNEALRALRLAQTDLRRASPVWTKATQDEDHVASTDEIRALLGPREAMLLYQIGREASLVVMVGGDGALDGRLLQVPDALAPRLGIEPGPLTVEKLRRILVPHERAFVDGTRGALLEEPAAVGPSGILDALQRAPGEIPHSALHALFDVLVPEPLRRSWDTLDAVAIVPDGLLHRLPFEALAVNDDGEFWLQNGPVVRYAPSATVMRVQDRRRRERARAGWSADLVTVSDPRFDRNPAGSRDDVSSPRASRSRTLLPLPGTALEAREILSHFTPDRAIVLQGESATESQVRESIGDARYLHFATHGLVQSRRDDVFAALALTPEAIPASDGFLELSEIYELQLRAELAVLSACTTHVGDWIEGDGVFALSRGFLAAGCDRVVGSLWLVDDSSTAALMGDFFARLTSSRSPGEDPARALWEARRSLLRDERWSHPFHWAPFVLVGLR